MTLTPNPSFRFTEGDYAEFQVRVDGRHVNLSGAHHVELQRSTDKSTVLDTLSTETSSPDNRLEVSDAANGWVRLRVDDTYLPTSRTSYYYRVRVYTSATTYFDCPRTGWQSMSVVN